MNEMSEDYILYKHYAQEFYKEAKKVIDACEIFRTPGHGKDSDLESLIASYEKFEKRRSVEMQQQVTKVWEHELEMHPKCKCSECERSRIMYSFFCDDHTQELLENPNSFMKE